MNAAHIRMSDTAHILVVDDDREIRTLLRDYLEKNGFKATAVADGQETRRALERTRFDLIVLDLMGYERWQCRRGNRRNRHRHSLWAP